MKIAIIGAAHGQMPLCLKAKELGHETLCFAWEKGAVCKDLVDKFYPISIFEKDEIADICRAEEIDGVISNASDATAEVASYIATQLKLNGIDYSDFLKIKDKSTVRLLTENVKGLSPVHVRPLTSMDDISFPCIVKPKTGSAKKGVYFVPDKTALEETINHASVESDSELFVEQYIQGAEISVETLSFHGTHYIVQTTDKENMGAPHFVELSHHQPSTISTEAMEKVKDVVPRILNAVRLFNGAAHIELRIDQANNVYLIEINPRGGGDEISNKLVQLSTGYDYLKGMIDVALNRCEAPTARHHHCAGIYFLCQQTAYRLPFFESAANEPWLVEKDYDISHGLNTATGNADRNGYLIYQSDSKVLLD